MIGDIELAVRLLRATPTHEHRTDEQLGAWADIALAYGEELAQHTDDPAIQVVDRDGGVRKNELLLAEHRRRVVIVYTDALARVEQLALSKGWPVTGDALRRAAIAHELAHERIDVRELNRRLGHTAARLGPLRVRGHVAGADEIAAHRFAHLRSGLGVSPLRITAALAGGH